MKALTTRCLQGQQYKYWAQLLLFTEMLLLYIYIFIYIYLYLSVNFVVVRTDDWGERSCTGDIPEPRTLRRVRSSSSSNSSSFNYCRCCESRGRQLLWLTGAALQGRVGEGFANRVLDFSGLHVSPGFQIQYILPVDLLYL